MAGLLQARFNLGEIIWEVLRLRKENELNVGGIKINISLNMVGG